MLLLTDVRVSVIERDNQSKFIVEIMDALLCTPWVTPSHYSQIVAVKIEELAEGDAGILQGCGTGKWFEEAVVIKNTLIQVSSIEKEYSSVRGDYAKFYKLVEPGETDSRLDTAAGPLKDLVSAVNKMNDNLGDKIDAMNDNLGGKMDLMIQKQDDLIDEVKESRKDLKGHLDQRFEKLEGEVMEMKIALKAKGII